MAQQSHLLNDEAILHFIARGYCVVKTNVAPRIHAQILTDAKKAMAESNPGNDILHAAPGLREIFDDEAMVGALSRYPGRFVCDALSQALPSQSRGHRRPNVSSGRFNASICWLEPTVAAAPSPANCNGNLLSAPNAD